MKSKRPEASTTCWLRYICSNYVYHLLADKKRRKEEERVRQTVSFFLACVCVFLRILLGNHVPFRKVPFRKVPCREVLYVG